MINYNYILGNNLNILDYGCGSGANVIPLLNMGHIVTGIDIDPMCEFTIKNRLDKEAINRFRFILNSNNKNIYANSEIYDVILCTETLEHIINYTEIIKYLKSVLKRNGLLIISVPTHFSENIFSFFDKNWLHDSKHVNVFDEASFIDIFISFDFKLQRKERRGGDWFLTWVIYKIFFIRHNMGVPIGKNSLQKIIMEITPRLINIIRYLKPIHRLIDYIIPKSIVLYFNK